MNLTILTLDSIDSTNTEALKQARQGADEGLCIVARQQTAGRGRRGRTWVSEKDAGLYFSIVLRPKIETKYLTLITLIAGIAVHATLQELGLKPDIKWVNDILVNEKKISGILAETTETGAGLAVIVGIGINLRSTKLPVEIADIATSVEESIVGSSPYEGGVEGVSPDGMALSSQLIEALTKHLANFYEILNSECGPAMIIDEWSRRSSYFSEKPVRVVLENETITGITDGLEANGALRVKGSNGQITIVQAGDVQQLRSGL
jgi:BirA family transcriptional regulator, biotin operon repressor / biotin---[acetyl-CoA-carboxylase] ligase